MAQNYRVIEIAGPSSRAIRIPTVDVAATTEDGKSLGFVRSPEWMVKLDDVMKSNVDGFEDSAELFGWYGESSRFTTGDIGNQLFTSSTLQHSDVALILPNGGYAATLETKMNKGEHIAAMTIVRLGHIKEVKVKLQEILYEICRIRSFQQELDKLVLQLNVTRKTNTIFVYDMEGANQGQMVSKVDYAKNTAE